MAHFNLIRKKERNFHSGSGRRGRPHSGLLFFVDDNLLSNREAAKDLFRDLIPLKIRWMSQGTVDMTRDPELMSLMCRSGCLGMVVGFESLNPASLQSIKKTPNLHSLDDYAQAIQVVRNHGLQLWAAFTLGHDHDTVESIRETEARSRFNSLR